MARAIPWRNKPPTVLQEKIEQVQNSLSFLVLQQNGPTSFVLKNPDDPQQRKFKVRVGALQQCSCASANEELCEHILFVMLKLFRVPRLNPLVWQRALLEAEIEQLVSGRLHQQQSRQQRAQEAASALASAASRNSATLVEVPRRAVEEGDSCPICCEDYSDRPGIMVYCRYGCGGNIHLNCFKQYAGHHASTMSSTPLQCPLCRSKWGSLDPTSEACGNGSCLNGRANTTMGPPHSGIACNHCRSGIFGDRFRCAFCTSFNLCSSCFAIHDVHAQHPFDVCSSPGEPFLPATRPVPGSQQPSRSEEQQNTEANPTDPRLAALLNRSLGPEDYELLLHLDDHIPSVPSAGGPSSSSLMTVAEVNRLNTILFRGDVEGETFGFDQCAICLQNFAVAEQLVILPLCNHVFHRSCALRWLTESKAVCPVDNSPVAIHQLMVLRVTFTLIITKKALQQALAARCGLSKEINSLNAQAAQISNIASPTTVETAE